VNTYTYGNQHQPAVAADAAGNFVVAWIDRGSSYYVSAVFARRFASGGGPIGEAFQVSTYTTSRYTYPEVAADADGDFIVVWQARNVEVSHVIGKRFDSAGVEQFALPDRPFAGNPDVADEANGDFVVVWNESYVGYQSVFGQRYDSSGATLGSEFQMNSYTDPSTQLDPAVAMDADGDFVVVWERIVFTTQTMQDIIGQRFASDGAPVGSQFQANGPTAGYFDKPRVDSDADGNFVVVWDQTVPDVTDFVHASGFSSAGEQAFPDTTIAQGGVPDVAKTGDGTFVITWTFFDGNSAGIFAERFDSAGTALGSEFVVNAYTYSIQYRSKVAADPNGHFVIVWQSDSQDGDADGSFGRRLGDDAPSTF
jgi:hypothetical protein